MNLLQWNRFRIASTGLVAVFVIGTLGYMLIEGWSALDSLFMTAITISTVGYREVRTLSTGGEIFSIVLIVFGVGIMFYTATLVVGYVAEGYLESTLGRRKMKDQIRKIEDHFIVCGYGRVGQEVVSNLKQERVSFVVVELEESRVQRAIRDDCLCLQGDVTSDEILKEAGVERAKVLIAAVRNDVDNVFVTLSARELKPDIFIAARASDSDSEHKLRRAGADRVIFPQRLGGRRMAMVALRPRVVDFIDTTVYSRDQALGLEDIFITSDSPVAGKTVREGMEACGGGAIVAVKRKDGSLASNPPLDAVIEAGDEVVAIGTKQQLRVLEGSVI